MSSQSKADKFAAKAREHGWTVAVQPEPDDPDIVDVFCERGEEKIHIYWQDNSLIEAPTYKFQGYEVSLHNAAGATRRLAEKPDPRKVLRKRRSLKGDDDMAGALSQEEIDAMRHPLPFDQYEDPDSVILKALRGKTLVVINTISSKVEAIHVPTARNRSRDNIYLTEGKDDRLIFNFLSDTCYRAVAVDNILQIQ